MCLVKNQVNLKIWAFLLAFLPIGLSAMASNGIMSAYETEKPLVTLTGMIENINGTNRLISCIAECLTNTCGCKGVLFDKNQPKTQRCLHVSYGSQVITLNEFPEFKYYSIKEQELEVCRDLKIGVTPAEWTTSCPRLYFPLDDAKTGNAKRENADGTSADNIQFVDGKLGKALYNPTRAGELLSYYHLGTYPRTEFCFGFPDTCISGMSISFWLNIKDSTGNKQGFITTMSSTSPGGFMVYFREGYGLYFRYVTNGPSINYVTPKLAIFDPPPHM